MALSSICKLFRFAQKTSSTKNIFRAVRNTVKNLKTPIFKKGKYGHECSKSSPLKNFITILQSNSSIKRGRTTPNGTGLTFLRGKSDEPIATQVFLIVAL